MPQFDLPVSENFGLTQWWHPHDGDPAPDWLVDRLSRDDLVTIAKAQLEFRQTELEAELKYINVMNELVARKG